MMMDWWALTITIVYRDEPHSLVADLIIPSWLPASCVTAPRPGARSGALVASAAAARDGLAALREL